MIDDIKIIAKKELKNPKFIKPFCLHFNKSGKERTWECISAMDSVSALLYHKDLDSFVLVKQFRPAVWAAKGALEASSGYTYELCAGLMDKGLSHKQTIIEEIAEETGYLVKDIKRITMTRGGFGFSGNAQTMFYACIDESMRFSAGGGVDDEDIELFYLPRKQALSFAFDEDKTKGFGLIFALFWWRDKFKKELS